MFRCYKYSLSLVSSFYYLCSSFSSPFLLYLCFTRTLYHSDRWNIKINRSRLTFSNSLSLSLSLSIEGRLITYPYRCFKASSFFHTLTLFRADNISFPPLFLRSSIDPDNYRSLSLSLSLSLVTSQKDRMVGIWVIGPTPLFTRESLRISSAIRKGWESKGRRHRH